MMYLILAVLAMLVLARPVYAVVRFALLPAAAKRNYPAALWARFRWRWLCANLGLSYLDRHKKAVKKVPFGTSVKVTIDAGGIGKLRFPRAHIRADAFGLAATIKTVPGVGRPEFEQAAEHIANAWKCHRAQIHQERPGRITVRGLRTDPLLLPFPMEDAPAGVFGAAQNYAPADNSARPASGVISGLRKVTHVADNSAPLRLYAGRDEWGTDRWITLPGTTGITVGGLPMFGKTSLATSWLCQLAPSPAVQFVFIDGKGGGDYSDWEPRAWIYTGDELPAAAAGFEDVHALMRSRLAEAARTGVRNWWREGPRPGRELIVTVVDECHTFLDLDAVKGDQAADRFVRTCRTLGGQLTRKGRSVLMLTIWITQKQTSDAIPTAIRDNCRVGISFATKTRDAAVAGLGEHIREYPSYCPTTLQDPAYVGVCTAAMRTGHDPFVRLRVPEITEEAAAGRALETAHLRRDPRTVDTTRPPALVS